MVTVYLYIILCAFSAGVLASGYLKEVDSRFRFASAAVGATSALMAITQAIEKNIMFALEIYLKTQ